MCHHFCRNEATVKGSLIYCCFVPTLPYFECENAVLVNWEWRQCVKGRSSVVLSTKKSLIHHSGPYNVLEISTKCTGRKRQLIVWLSQLLLYWAGSPRQMLKGDSKPQSGWGAGMKIRTFFVCVLFMARWVSCLLPNPSAHWVRCWQT